MTTAHILLSWHGHLLPADGSPVTGSELAERIKRAGHGTEQARHHAGLARCLRGGFYREAPGLFTYDEDWTPQPATNATP